jgi:hypothetical protein
MATSPNFNWPEPDNTDLVKNGALAIRTAVNAIDSSLVDLKGGTTGQVLAKATNTDMDFAWVAQDDANAIQNTQLTAKGALISAFSAGTPATLTVGTNGQILTADSTEATGLKWTTPTGGGSGVTLVKTQAIGSSVSSITVTNAFSTTYDAYTIIVTGSSSASITDMKMTLGAATSGYYYALLHSTYDNTPKSVGGANQSSWRFIGASGANAVNLYANVYNPFLADYTNFSSSYIAPDASGSNQGFLNTTTSYTDFTITGNSMTGGNIRVYGWNK